MFHIAIVEDSEKDLKKLISHLHLYEEESKNRFNIDSFKDADKFLDKYRPIYDLIFMDIELPNTNGMNAAKKIRSMDSSVVIIFITNLSQFAVKSYEVNALDYIVKPYPYATFFIKMQKAIKYISKNNDLTINIPTKTGLVRLSLSHIEYIEVKEHQLFYHTEEGIIEIRGSLKNVEEQLLPLHFLRCNNCYLVNLRHVKAVIGNDVIVGSTKLSISRPKRRFFVDGLTNYLGV